MIYKIITQLFKARTWKLKVAATTHCLWDFFRGGGGLCCFVVQYYALTFYLTYLIKNLLKVYILMSKNLPRMLLPSDIL